MNNTKLTLSVEAGMVAKAKEYALKHHTSVSRLFMDLMNEVIEKDKASMGKDPLLEKLRNTELPESIKSLTGILKGKYPDDANYRDLKYEYLKEKYDL